MKPKALTVTSKQDHATRFPASPDGSWWMAADRESFTARATQEVPRMTLAKFGPSFAQTFSEASHKRHARLRSAFPESEDV